MTKPSHQRALETFDAWADETGHYWDPVIIPSKEWRIADPHSTCWKDLVKRITEAIQDAVSEGKE